jgi:FtsP/CotA-like multicopper oxidase with cupredoxin domain
LPIPPVLSPSTNWADPSTGETIDFFEITITKAKMQSYPNLPKTNYVGYNGLIPGPTFKITRGRQAVVRVVNKGDRPTSTHLHGEALRAPFDGWAEDITNPGEFKDYYYPNDRAARTLWYHDHAVLLSGANVNDGLAGFYIISDPQESLSFPSGQYDVPLMLGARQFRPDGQLWSPIGEDSGFHGDVIVVNGQPWPFMAVEPRKYRFRLLSAGIIRTFSAFLVADSQPSQRLAFAVIGTDSGLTSHPVYTNSVIIAAGERYEVIIDFAPFAGRNLTMMNERGFQSKWEFPATNKIMRFVVGHEITSSAGNGPIPAKLATIHTPVSRTSIDHTFILEKKNGLFLINGVGFANISNRILAKPKRGVPERWKIINNNGKGENSSHPMHIHQIEFQVVSRNGSSAAVRPYEAAGLKDIVDVGKNEEVELIANYQPWAGVYLFHCHNLFHEDYDMMAAINVSDVDLTKFGYKDTVSQFTLTAYFVFLT